MATLNEKKMRWEQWATKSLYFIGGFGAATWAPLVPLIRENLQLTEDVLGMLLLCIGIGSLCTMPFSGAAANKWGCRRVLVGASVLYAVVLLLITQASSLYMLVPLILMLGALMGAVDIVVNVLSVIVERESGKRLMSGMHAFWSIGGFVGAGIFSMWLTMGLNHFEATVIAAVIIAILLVIFQKHLKNDSGEKKEGSLFILPRGIVFWIGLAAFISFLVEGAVMDWGGVFLTTIKGFDMSLAAVGFTLFSAAMLIMRLTGDAIVNKLGPKAVIIGGAFLAGMGFVLLIVAPYDVLLYLGFFCIGIGSANIVPVFFSLMGRQKVMPIGQAVSAVGTMGYLGILAGPASIGFVANATSLLVSFGMLATLVFCEMAIGQYVFGKFGK